MSKLSLIIKIKEIYNTGENILKFLKKNPKGPNEQEAIMISYDCQAGTYTRLAKENAGYLHQYTDAIKKVIDELPIFKSIMEVGVGEATLMTRLMAKIDPKNSLRKYGFDISWSRVRYARRNSEAFGIPINLFMANLFEIPLPDSSVDIIYTSHSLEPNGGKEREALKELYRVARKFLILLEPNYETANKHGKRRMVRHGYVKNLVATAKDLGYEIVAHRPFEVSLNPLNPTGLTVIRKKRGAILTKLNYVCPVTKTKLKLFKNCYCSIKAGLIYPIVDEIPCLLSQHAILALHFPQFNKR
jgi:hypothetical protein